MTSNKDNNQQKIIIYQTDDRAVEIIPATHPQSGGKRLS